MSKNDSFKRFRVIQNVGVLDDLTGEVLSTFRDFCDALNKVDERANLNAELYFDLLYKDDDN